MLFKEPSDLLRRSSGVAETQLGRRAFVQASLQQIPGPVLRPVFGSVLYLDRMSILGTVYRKGAVGFAAEPLQTMGKLFFSDSS